MIDDSGDRCNAFDTDIEGFPGCWLEGTDDYEFTADIAAQLGPGITPNFRLQDGALWVDTNGDGVIDDTLVYSDGTVDGDDGSRDAYHRYHASPGQENRHDSLCHWVQSSARRATNRCSNC